MSVLSWAFIDVDVQTIADNTTAMKICIFISIMYSINNQRSNSNFQMNVKGIERVELRAKWMKQRAGRAWASSVSVKHGSNAGSCSEAKRFRVVRNSQTKQ